jgi:hypothetical protein
MSNETVITGGLRVELDVLNHEGREWVSKIAYDELLGAKKALDADIAQLRKNGALTDVEKAENKRNQDAVIEMKAWIDEIAVFIRTHYAKEIELGQHAAFKSLADAVKFYMGRERQMTAAAENKGK